MDKTVQTSCENGKIQYKLLTSQYLDEASSVINVALFSGSVSRAVGIPEDPEALAELTQFCHLIAEDGVSLVAIEPNQDKVVAVVFNKLFKSSNTFLQDLKKVFKNPRSLKMLDFIINAEGMCDLFKLCQVDCLMEIFFLGTLPDYQKRGIGKKLCEISVDIAQNLCDGVKKFDGQELKVECRPKAVTALFASVGSQKIGKELGFQVAAEREKMPNSSEIIMLEYKKLKQQ